MIKSNEELQRILQHREEYRIRQKKEYNRKYYQAHTEQERERARKWYWEHIEQQRERCRIYNRTKRKYKGDKNGI